MEKNSLIWMILEYDLSIHDWGQTIHAHTDKNTWIIFIRLWRYSSYLKNFLKGITKREFNSFLKVSYLLRKHVKQAPSQNPAGEIH